MQRSISLKESASFGKTDAGAFFCAESATFGGVEVFIEYK